MQQAILHVGFAKTASTSIQNTLASERRHLSSYGFSFAKFTLNGREITNHSLALTYLFSEKASLHHVHAKYQLDAIREKKRAQKELETSLDTNGTVILSGEEVPFFAEDELRKIKEYFDKKHIPLRVVALVRPTISFLESLAQQFVKSGFPLTPAYNNTPAKMMQRILRVFPDAEFYSFQEACAHPEGIVDYFLKKVGLNTKPMGETSKDNPALSDNAARLCAFINNAAPIVQKGSLNILRSEGDIRALSRIKGPKFYLRANEINFNQIKAENEWLEHNYGSLFSDDLSDLPKNDCEWTQKQIVQVARAIEHIPLPLVPLVYAYFLHSATLAEGAKINPIKKMVHKSYFEQPEVVPVSETGA